MDYMVSDISPPRQPRDYYFRPLFTERNSGENLQEDPIAMLAQYPLMNEYWADKRAKVELIDVPAYILGSMSSGLHTIGSVRGFEDLRHEKKWSV